MRIFGLGLVLGLSCAACGCDAGAKSALDHRDAGGMAGSAGAAGSAAAGQAGLGEASSVCSFSGPSELPAADADGSIPVPATHPLVAYTGRVDCQAPGGPALGYVGASVRVRFSGTGLELKLKDYGAGTPETTNYYDVAVDGSEPTLLEVSPQQERYVLAADLSDGEHQVELFKRVEAAPGGSSGAGKAEILGFVLRGSALLPALQATRRLEFVGDSITCGYGNELETTTPDTAHYTTRNSNGHKAYGAVTAQLLGAQYSAVAFSGRGMSRSYAGGAGQIMPEMYLSSIPEDTAAGAWDPAQYVPDAVVINLGTNDFSTTGVDRALFVQNYVDFLTTLRGYYPKAALVAAIGPMLSDYYPPGEKAWTNAQADIKAAVDARVATGDANVHFLAFAPQTAPYGEDWHPTIATHRKMAEELSAALKGILGW
jgi:lysophospholipase L1-like esterase